MPQEQEPTGIIANVVQALDSVVGHDKHDWEHKKGNRDWTKAIKAALCERGRKLGWQVHASGVEFVRAEWLYDVSWLDYSEDRLINVHLAGECEWGGLTEIKYDFEKLLQTRASVRLMIYNGNQDPGSEKIAQRLIQYIAAFNRGRLSHDEATEDRWLLTAWELYDTVGEDVEWDTMAPRFVYFSKYGLSYIPTGAESIEEMIPEMESCGF